MKQIRGNNQSINTKWATCLIWDAFKYIEMEDLPRAKENVLRALRLLPDIRPKNSIKK